MSKRKTGILILALTLLCGGLPGAYAKKGDAKGGVNTAPVELKEMNSLDGLGRWMTYYYMHPQPELFVPALLLADKLELLKGDSSAPLQAFASRIFAQHPDKLKGWFQELSLLSDNGKSVILTSIWWSDCKEGKELLETISQQIPEKSRAEFHKQVSSAPPQIEKMDIDSPDVLDMLWACFSATGDEKYVKRLLETLSWGKSDSKDLPKMLIASAARWSLMSNIEQHEKVKEICQSLDQSDKELKPYLDKLFVDIAARAEEKSKETAKESKTKDEKKNSGEEKPSKAQSEASVN